METQTDPTPEAPQNTSTRLVIIGGVAGGASAAARARRLSEDAEIIIFERGPHVSFANCGLPYHIGGDITDRERLLVQTPESLNSRYQLDVRTLSEVVSIDREAKEVVVRNLKTDEEYRQPYDALILSPGAAPIRPPLPGADGERVLTLRNIPDMDAIKAVVDDEKPERAVVIGGGYIGLEMAEALRHRDVEVTLVERLPQVMGPADPEMVAPLHQQLRMHGVDLRLGASVSAISESGNKSTVTLDNGDEVEAGLVIMSIGVRPESGLAKDAGLELGPRGGIKVDDQMRTSDPSIYAVGDAVEVSHYVTGEPMMIPLAGPANRQGRIAADNIFGKESAYRHTQGTAICKLFDTSIAMTGASEKLLKQSGVAYDKVYVHPSSHASYYPGAAKLTMKLLFAPDTGKILGAQAVGPDGADKRIDVIATAQRAGMTVEDLEHLELCYAPPYGSAKDPVNYAGFVAANVMRGEVMQIHVDELDSLTGEHLLLDTRTDAEVPSGMIGDAVHIPVDELRDRLGELPKDKEIIAYCAAGLRGYIASRILMQHGYRVRNLAGGYTTWKAFQPDKPSPNAKQEKTVNTPKAEKEEAPVKIVKDIDACGLQCPGPIMQLNNAVTSINPGESIAISVTDPGFAADVSAWCDSTGNTLVSLESEKGVYKAVIQKNEGAGAAACPTSSSAINSKNKTMVVFSGDWDKVMASFIIANGASAMGSKVTMFFTFWGLNALRRPESVPVEKNLIEKMFGWMMPRGAGKLGLSKMHMGGMGLAMMKGIMKKKNVSQLEDLIASAQQAGVRMIACTMSMDLMGIKTEELIDGVDEGGVAMYLNNAEQGGVNLFI